MLAKCFLLPITRSLNTLLSLLIMTTGTEVSKPSLRLSPMLGLLGLGSSTVMCTITGMTVISNDLGFSNLVLCMTLRFRMVNQVQPGFGLGECDAARAFSGLPVSILFCRCWSFRFVLSTVLQILLVVHVFPLVS